MSGNRHDPLLPSDEAFDRWYAQHFARLRTLCSKILRDPSGAEDIAQETLVRAWVHRDRLRDEDVGAWLSVVARNLCISLMRKERRSSPTEAVPEIMDFDADPAVVVTSRESRRSVRSALARMGERHRNVLYLHEVGGADYEELGSRFGLSAAGARTVAFRARRVLREHLAAVGEGLSGILLGVRMRMRGIIDRAKSSIQGMESGLIPAAQTGVNIALAIGVTLAGVGSTGALGSSAVAEAATRSKAPVLSSEPLVVGPSYTLAAHSFGQPTGGRSGKTIAGVPFNEADLGDTGPGGHIYDEGDGSTEIVIHLAGQELWNRGRRMEGDGLDDLYTVEDAAAAIYCDHAPQATEYVRCEPRS